MEVSTEPAPILQARLFSSPEILRSGKRLSLPATGKITSLLAYLILHPYCPHSREKLATLYWGDTTDERARHSLRTALTTLRHLLGDEFFITDDETIQINPAISIWVDAFEFQKAVSSRAQMDVQELVRAIDLYQGELLENFYEDWVLRERDHFQELYLELLLHMTQVMRSRSDYARAIEYAARVLVCDPSNERAHQHLIFCHLASGDRAAAIRQYAECKRLLQEDLGVDPSPETTALHQWISQTPVKAPEARITNLPIPLTSFIGRSREMTRVKDLLAQARLVTLTGAGGCGKTRLAIQVASDLVDSFKDGVWWVDFSPVMDPARVFQTVARVFAIDENPDVPITETLVKFMSSRNALLVLDNCEHLVAEIAQLCFTLLRSCSKMKILTTSREVLTVLGEMTLKVPSLSFPMSWQPSGDENLEEYESIHLFRERAVAVNAEFDLTEDNATALVQICQRLDGIPLAIELAAACVRFLPAQQIALRLNDRFNLLTDGSRTALPRHQTLHAVIDWSYNLLTEKEQLLLGRMSVCVGGWTLEAAEAVCSVIDSPLEVLELLARLIDKSLVEVAELPGGAARYRMLETVRQYGLERLSETGQLNEARHRHALFFASLAEDAEKQLRGSEMRTWMRRLETEHDNFRVALDWSLSYEPPEMGLRFAGALGIFWHRGYLREGSAWLERLLTYGKDAPPYMRVKAMATLSWIARDLGDYAHATKLCEQALEILHRTQNKVETVPILIQSGLLAVYQNDPERALVCFEECLALSDELDYRWGRAMSLVNLAHAALFNLQWDTSARSRAEDSLEIFKAFGDETEQAHALIILGPGAHYEHDDQRGRRLVEQAVTICKQAGDKRQLAWSTSVLGVIIRWLGNIDEALPVAKEGLRLAIELGEKTITTFAIISLAGLAYDRGNINLSLHLLGFALTWSKSFGYQPSALQWDIVGREVDAMRSTLGEEAFAQACEAGASLPFEQAIQFAMQV